MGFDSKSKKAIFLKGLLHDTAASLDLFGGTQNKELKRRLKTGLYGEFREIGDEIREAAADISKEIPGVGIVTLDNEKNVVIKEIKRRRSIIEARLHEFQRQQEEKAERDSTRRNLNTCHAE